MKPLRPKTSRILLLSLFLVLIFAAMFARLHSMMISNSTRYTARASSQATKNITIYGKRGTIYDTNMVPLAYDETSWNVTFYRDPTRSEEADRAAYTQVLIKTIQLIESNGKSTITDFWLKKDEDGIWRFNSGSPSEAVERSRERQWRTNFYMSNVEEEPELKRQTPSSSFFIQKSLTVVLPLDSTSSITLISTWV